jgi:adenosylmethionine-8-amino-7-oxononanoate aminotransferase
LPEGITNDTACEYYLDGLKRMLDSQGDQIAAVVIEPLVQGAAGMVTHPPGFLRGVRRLTKEYEVLLIADEVAVGFGRTGTMFACEQEQVTPDLLCLGKGLTGGYLPMAATLATSEIWREFLGDYAESKTFFHGHTYGGNPLAAAVALATLDVFQEEQTLDHLQPKIRHLGEILAEIAELPHVGDVRQLGLLAGIELVRNRETREAYPWQEKKGIQVCEHTTRHGVWLRPLGNVVVVMPPLSISLAQLTRIGDAIREAITAVTACE